MDMLSAKKLQRICFFILLFIWISICITNIYSRLDNVNTSVNIVTESLVPLKQALCMNYAANKLYSTNGKLHKAVKVTALKLYKMMLCTYVCLS